MTKKKFLDVLFGVALAAAGAFVAVLAVPQGPLNTPRLAELR